MKAINAQWFECKIRYEKYMENGLVKKVTEQYAVDALSYTEAEKRIIEEMKAYISGEFEVATITKAAYKEVFFDDGDNCSDRYYRAKLDFITIDKKTDQEKRCRTTYLVQATTLKNALENVNKVMGGTMIDYEAAAITDTKLLDVFLHQNTQETDKEK